ncbi:hypothetical protein FRC01_009297, partial [Tulasnella sp. 417]
PELVSVSIEAVVALGALIDKNRRLNENPVPPVARAEQHEISDLILAANRIMLNGSESLQSRAWIQVLRRVLKRVLKRALKRALQRALKRARVQELERGQGQAQMQAPTQMQALMRAQGLTQTQVLTLARVLAGGEARALERALVWVLAWALQQELERELELELELERELELELARRLAERLAWQLAWQLAGGVLDMVLDVVLDTVPDTVWDRVINAWVPKMRKDLAMHLQVESAILRTLRWVWKTAYGTQSIHEKRKTFISSCQLWAPLEARLGFIVKDIEWGINGERLTLHDGKRDKLLTSDDLNGIVELVEDLRKDREKSEFIARNADVGINRLYMHFNRRVDWNYDLYDLREQRMACPRSTEKELEMIW